MKKSRFSTITAVFIATTLIFSSCHEDIEYSNLHTLRVDITASALLQASDSTTRTAISGFEETFETGDQIGVYAVDGTSAVASNVCFTWNGTEWVGATEVEYNEDYDYYAYYPYVASPYTPDFTQAATNDIFASFIADASDKFHFANQSTKANFNASDLMIVKGTHLTDNIVKFSMEHKKALALFTGDVNDVTFTGNLPYLSGSTKNFLMKPGTKTTFTIDDSPVQFYAPSGKYVTHAIEGYTDFILTVTPPSSYTHSGGTNSYSVTSYKQNAAGTKTKVAAWTASYDTDGDGVFDDAKPSWLTTFTESGAGSTSATAYSATVAAQTASVTSTSVATTNAATLRAKPAVSNYDLSTKGGSETRTTANCYLVNAPGTYAIPLVYGNAIKDGSTNSAAYNPSGTSSATFLKPFINHAGNAITNPWIKNNGITVNGAELIWQDAPGLVKNGSVTIDGDYLFFEIPAATITEGNAVIAVKSGSTIVWSWHIWVTLETFQSGIVYDTYTVANCNLGWVDASVTTTTGYAARSCDVKITQPGGQTQTFTVSQTGSSSSVTTKSGYCPYYQWGRKDPMPPSTGTGNTFHTIYNISGGTVSMSHVITYTSTADAQKATIINGIKNPLTMYRVGIEYTEPEANTFLTWQGNLWDGTNTSTSNNCTGGTVKTIYDPCPRKTGIPRSNQAYYYTRWPSETTVVDGGLQHYNLFYPFAGAIGYAYGELRDVGSACWIWSATPYLPGDGDSQSCESWHTYGTSSNKFKEYSDPRAYAMSVRPCWGVTY